LEVDSTRPRFIGFQHFQNRRHIRWSLSRDEENGSNRVCATPLWNQLDELDESQRGEPGVRIPRENKDLRRSATFGAEEGVGRIGLDESEQCRAEPCRLSLRESPALAERWIPTVFLHGNSGGTRRLGPPYDQPFFPEAPRIVATPVSGSGKTFLKSGGKIGYRPAPARTEFRSRLPKGSHGVRTHDPPP